MRRRFRSEVAHRKAARISQRSATTVQSETAGHTNVSVAELEAKDIEESLFKLGQLSKKKVRIDDFTAKDRFVILDLFVNNEKTLLSIYEALFPPRHSGSGTIVGHSSQPYIQAYNNT